MTGTLLLILAGFFFLCDGFGVPPRVAVRSWTPLGFACWSLALLTWLNPGGLPPWGG